MAEVIQETLTNTEEQENAVETDNVSSSHSSPLFEEQHNQQDFTTCLSATQNEHDAVEEEESIEESTMSIAEIYNALPLLGTGQEQVGEEQAEPMEAQEAQAPAQMVEEGRQQKSLEEQEEDQEEDQEEEQEEDQEEEQEEDQEENQEEEVEQEVEEEQENQEEQEEQRHDLHQQQLQYQNDNASANTSYSSTTDNSIISQQQQQQQQQEEEEEEETRNTLPEITAPPPTTISYNRTRSASTATPSTMNGLLPRSQRIWEMDRQASECRRCHRRFNFLVRRHHCRRCGQIVCDKCSSHRIRLPVEELIEDPMVSTSQYPLLASQTQRVCDTCYREPIRRSSESHSRTAYPIHVPMRRTDSSQSLMIDCPVCGHSFLGMPKQEQEEHLQRCLNVGSPPVQSPRYIVYQLSNDSTQLGDECPICFDEFNPGDKVSRMICLCSYHQHCLSAWLQRGKGCPIHYDSLQI